MAMVGVLFIGVIVYKKTMVQNRFSKNQNDLKIENALNLSQRKTLYVIQAGNEKFLIAADAERTSFLAKLNQNETQPLSMQKQQFTTVEVEPVPSKPVDYSEVMASLKRAKNGQKQPVMRELLNKLSTPAEQENK